ncbi:MAG: hypothetical protein IT273_14710 [Chitinophagales bacterium]|nr:hypothetical protein [Chitinophagales bacterium]
MKRTVLPYETSLDDAYRHFGEEFYVLQIGNWLSYWDCIAKAIDYYLAEYARQPYALYKFKYSIFKPIFF